MNCETVRAFMAVEITDEVRRRLVAWQEKAAERLPPVSPIKWVRGDALHLTLAFLGDIPSASVAAASAALDEAAGGSKPFSCDITGVGFFGHPAAPRVIWADVRGDTEALGRLQRQVSRELAARQFVLDPREFVAHLTLARVRFKRNLSEFMAGVQASREQAFGTIPVADIVLIRSELTAGGPKYTVLHRAKLGGASEQRGGDNLDGAGGRGQCIVAQGGGQEARRSAGEFEG